ncbi:MAG: hypothetical protein L6Q37_02845 [Bdellovibrionaceae bacterium]|nr:hypothetical protein [Pseudobdellovibrionaceae bacterium]NUM58823.1 hypothetical protein [Pseudobdellovibrionaceae bacterium]
MIKVSIQGMPGSFSHIAAEHFFPDLQLICNTDFKSTFASLAQEVADFAVVPIENSTIGSIIENYTWLTNYPFHVIGEVFIKVNFHLAAIKESLLSEITEVYSHAAGLGQIVNFLAEHPNLKIVEYFDTAGAAQMVAETKKRIFAAACSRKAAQINGLKIIKENIHDNPKNFTRFFLLSKTPLKSKQQDSSPGSASQYRTSLQFEISHRSGSLSEFLTLFANQGLSLTKIESRPIPSTDWEYRFYIDVLSNPESMAMKLCLEEAKSKCSHLRVLGQYPIGAQIES